MSDTPFPSNSPNEGDSTDLVPIPPETGIDTHNLMPEEADMEYRIQLRNGRKFNATSYDGEHFVVTLAKGQKTYHLAEVNVIKTPQQDEIPVSNLTDDTKEDKVETLYHFMAQINRVGKDGNDEPVFMRVITDSFINIEEREAYFKSLETKAPVASIFALNTGNWEPMLLKYRTKGIKFRLTVISHNDLAKLPGKMEEKMPKVTFAWATETFAFFLDADVKGWGLEAFGLTAEFSKKLPKRLQEMARLTCMGIYDEDGTRFWFTDCDLLDGEPNELAEFVVAKFTTPEGMDVEVFDGMNYMTRYMARQMVLAQPKSMARDRLYRRVRDGLVNRLSIRVLTPEGLIKGHCIIVDDRSQLNGADLVYLDENMKTELKTTGWTLATAFVYDPLHVATHDFQSNINNRLAISYDHQHRDIHSFHEEVEGILISGELPEWMALPQHAHTDTGLVDIDKLGDDIKKSHIRWLASGLSITDSQNFMYMGINGNIKKMEKGWDDVTRTYKKLFIPMSNAMNAAVVTYSSMTLMGGFDLPSDGSKIFCLPKYGMIYPDHRFLETFDLHGTWDLDDVADFIRILVWCDEEDSVNNLKDDGVLDMDVDIPTTKDGAQLMALVVRSPNGPGEYSLEMIQDDVSMPWSKADDDNLTVVNLKDLPRGQNHLLSKVTKGGLPESKLAFGVPMTRDHGRYMLEAQATNPGIGSVANIMMVWVDTFGPSFPPFMTEVFNELVDVTAQEFDKERLAAISKEVELVFNQLVERLEAYPGKYKIDSHLAMTRLGKLVESLPENCLADRRWRVLVNLYAGTYRDLRDRVAKHTLEVRLDSTVVQKVKSLRFADTMDVWAAGFFKAYNDSLQAVDRKYRIHRRDTPFTKISKGYNKKLELQAVVAAAVRELENMEYTNTMVLGLYRYILKSDKNRGLGEFDRLIFQPGGDTSKSIMDLLIDALKGAKIV